MDASEKSKRGLAIINRMSELNEQHEKLMIENGHPKGAMPVYVEFNKEQWAEYERNREEHKRLLAELTSMV